MCIVLDEEALAVLALAPRRFRGILDTDETYAVEIKRSEPGSTLLYSYCIIDMTREEIIQYANRLKKLDILDGIWYKYFEDNNVLEVFQLSLLEPIMNEQAEAAKMAAMGHFQRNSNKYKAIGWMLLGAIIGGVSVTAKAKMDAEKNAGVGSGA